MDHVQRQSSESATAADIAASLAQFEAMTEEAKAFVRAVLVQLALNERAELTAAGDISMTGKAAPPGSTQALSKILGAELLNLNSQTDLPDRG